MRLLGALALAMLIGTTSVRASADDEVVDPDGGPIDVPDTRSPEDASSTGEDAVPGPRLPNGEAIPPPDLVTDTGGCSCRAVAAAASPLPYALVVAAVFALCRRR